MQLEYDFTPEDYIRIWERYYARSPEARRELQTYYFGIALIMIGMGIVLSALNNSLSLPMYVWMPFILLLAHHNWNKRVQRSIRKGVEEARKRGYFGRHTLTISEEGVATECETVKSARQWRAIAGVVTNEPDVAFNLGFRSAIIVPASAFSDDWHRQAFLEKVMEYREQAAGMDDPS